MRTPDVLVTISAVLCLSLATHVVAAENMEDDPRAQTSSKVYAVQVGSFRQPGNAQRTLERLRKRYADSRILRVKGPSGERIYLVITGVFTSLEAAYQRKAALARLGISTRVIETTLPKSTTKPDGEQPTTTRPTQTAVDGKSTETSAPKSAQLTRSDDDKRPEDQYTVTVRGRPLTIGGEYSFTSDNRKDFALANNAKDDESKIALQAQLELFYPFTETNSGFFEVKAVADREIHREDNRSLRSNDGLERGEMWVHLDELFGSDFGLQLGRQDFDESREWWWDEDLDAVRLHYDRRPWSLEFSVAEELARVSTIEDRLDPEQEDVRRLLGHATWRFAKRHRLEFFLLDQRDQSFTHQEGQVIDKRDEDESDADLTWIGVRAKGRWKTRRLGRFYYWLDTAIVRGDELLIDFDDAGPGQRIVDEIEKRDVRGWGADLGITWQTRLSWRPSFTLGYAIGSGDSDPDKNDDRNFRQTGLHDNSGRFRGVNSFRYYGELLRPELSNLHILTASIGFPIWKNSSVEIVYHRYRQDEAATFLRDVRIDADPLGIRRDIGEELDIVIGLEKWKHLELEFVAARFRAGDAFGNLNRETATGLSFELNYNF